MFINFAHEIISLRWLINPRILLVYLGLLAISANVFAADVALTWAASTAANVGGYKVYYGQNSGIYTASVDVGNTTR